MLIKIKKNTPKSCKINNACCPLNMFMSAVNIWTRNQLYMSYEKIGCTTPPEPFIYKTIIIHKIPQLKSRFIELKETIIFE